MKGKGDSGGLLLIGHVGPGARQSAGRSSSTSDISGRQLHTRMRSVGGDVQARREVRFHQGRPILALNSIDTMNDAEALAGAELSRPRHSRRCVGDVIRHDLVGCEVSETHGRVLGRIMDGPMEHYSSSSTAAAVIRAPHLAGGDLCACRPACAAVRGGIRREIDRAETSADLARKRDEMTPARGRRRL